MSFLVKRLDINILFRGSCSATLKYLNCNYVNLATPPIGWRHSLVARSTLFCFNEIALVVVKTVILFFIFIVGTDLFYLIFICKKIKFQISTILLLQFIELVHFSFPWLSLWKCLFQFQTKISDFLLKIDFFMCTLLYSFHTFQY